MRVLYFAEGKSKDFRGLIFADHQVEYSVSLSHCFFSRIKICAQQAYSKIREIYVPRKLPRLRYVFATHTVVPVTRFSESISTGVNWICKHLTLSVQWASVL